MKNTVMGICQEINGKLFEQLRRLTRNDLSGEELTEEIKRSGIITQESRRRIREIKAEYFSKEGKK